MLPRDPRASLPTFSQASILVIGDVMLDRYWSGETARISPEAPVPVVQINHTDQRPGGAANVALNILALGAKVTLLGVTGLDEAGQILRAQLQKAELKVDLHESTQVDTIVKLRILSRHQQLIRIDFEKQFANEEIHHALLAQFKEHLANVQLVVLSDYLKGTLHHPYAFIIAARKANIPVIVDPKAHDANLYRGASWLTPNFKEFEAMVGPCPTEEILLEKARHLLSTYDIGNLLVTRGEQGMTLIERDTVLHLPAIAREVYDVTGAGDIVISTLGAALAAGASHHHAAWLANTAASISVTKLGAVTISARELENACYGVEIRMLHGILDEAQLVQMVQIARSLGKKIVFTNGCYDVIHAGHVKSLEMAKALGDCLIVAINSDESVRQLKGDTRPIHCLHHRMSVLAGLNAVDWIVSFSDPTPERLLQLLQPDILAKGGDYTLDQVVGADIVRAYGGSVQILQHDVTLSTSGIIQHIQSDLQAEHLKEIHDGG